jgi:hypothetical protein
MTQHKVAEAATLVGITRSTLFRHIREGRVTSTLSNDGDKIVDTSELIRVYGELHPAPKAHSAHCDKPTPKEAHSSSAVTVAVLEAKLEAAEAQLAEMREREAKYLDLIAAQSLKLIEKRIEHGNVEKAKRSWLNFWV